MSQVFTESVVEEAALAWFTELGYAILHGPEIAPGELFAERQNYGQVVLEDRLRQALVRLNPDLPPEALEDAFRKLIRPEGATLETRNRAILRDRLPPSLTSGDLWLKDAERIVGTI